METIGKIILVEDEELDANLTQMVLNSIPLANEIIWLENGEELIAYLDENGSAEIAICILDLKMPVMSGLEALEVIHSDEKDYGIFPIVVMTSSQEQPEIKRCYELGINAFVTKPVQEEEFAESVKTLGLFWAVLNRLPKNT